MNEKIKHLLIIIIIVLAGCYSIDKYMNSDVEVSFFADIYLHLWNGNLNITFLLIFLLGIQELCVIDNYNKVLNKFDKFIITRVGYIKHYLLEYKNIILKSSFYYLIIHLLLLCYIIVKYGYRSTSVDDMFRYQIFNNPNQVYNICMFIILSTIGVAIFNSFVFSFSTMIKNKYVYRFLPLILLFASLILSSVFSTGIQSIFGYDEYIKTIGMMFSVSNLIQPGMSFMRYGYTAFFTSSLAYTIIFAIITTSTFMMRVKYE